MASFKGAQFLHDVILNGVFFYVSYAVSYRDLEEILLNPRIANGLMGAAGDE